MINRAITAIRLHGLADQGWGIGYMGAMVCRTTKAGAGRGGHGRRCITAAATGAAAARVKKAREAADLASDAAWDTRTVAIFVVVHIRVGIRVGVHDIDTWHHCRLLRRCLHYRRLMCHQLNALGCDNRLALHRGVIHRSENFGFLRVELFFGQRSCTL